MLRFTLLFTAFFLGVLSHGYAQALQAHAGDDTVMCLEYNEPDSLILGGQPVATGGTGSYAYLWSTDLDTTVPGNTVTYWLSDSTEANPLFYASYPTEVNRAFYLEVTDSNQTIAYDTIHVEVCGQVPIPLGCSSGGYPTVGDTITFEWRTGHTCYDSVVWNHQEKIISQDNEALTIQVIVDDPTFDFNSFAANLYDDNGCDWNGGFLCPVVEGVYPLGIGERVGEDFEVYPNPLRTGEQLNLQSSDAIGDVMIIDALGHVVFRSQTRSNVMEVPLQLRAGIYIVQTRSEEHIRSRRLVVK